jgi:hypothetical protein
MSDNAAAVNTLVGELNSSSADAATVSSPHPVASVTSPSGGLFKRGAAARYCTLATARWQRRYWESLANACYRQYGDREQAISVANAVLAAIQGNYNGEEELSLNPRAFEHNLRCVKDAIRRITKERSEREQELSAPQRSGMLNWRGLDQRDYLCARLNSLRSLEIEARQFEAGITRLLHRVPKPQPETTIVSTGSC